MNWEKAAGLSLGFGFLPVSDMFKHTGA